MKKSYERLGIIVLVLIFLGIVLRMLLPLLYAGETYSYYPHMFGGMMFPMGMIGMGIFWVLVVIGIIWFVTKQPFNQTNNELSNLKKRLANGEITLEEYENIKKKINEV